MPLTAYSTSEQKEVDVYQLIEILSKQLGGNTTASADNIPESWRGHIREDIQCPCCFVTGADIVKESVSRVTHKAVRQACFRFVTPGHHAHCDFATVETANSIPENLVAFGDAKSKLTRAVRELVCTGLGHGIFSQRSIRDMREWFFNRKIAALFVVTLDPRFPGWIDGLQRALFTASGALPAGVPLTAEVAAMPDFDWRAQAARQLLDRYPQRIEVLAALQEKRILFFGVTDRVESLARRFQGRAVFDPTVLAEEYRKTCALAEFMTHNYGPIKSEKRSAPTSSSVLAFSALLLFINGWDMGLAISDFVRIAAAVGDSDPNLGNVMGLNPFHDYEAWTALKQVQELNVLVPQNADIKAEREAIEVGIRMQFAVPPAKI